MPIDYEHLQALGSIMGSGGMIVMDEDDCMVDVARFYQEFCVDESCGKCAPCRIGTRVLLNTLEKIAEGKGVARDLETIKVVRSVFKVLLKLAGVTVTVKGAENIPEDTAVLYVGNHRSYFDILAGYTTVPTLLGFVAKKEMEKIPLLRTWMVNVNCLFLDRKNIKEGLKMILQGIEKVKNGVSIWIFPEGTRNPNEDITELLPFKEGSLKIAEKSGCPVIPVAMTGTADGGHRAAGPRWRWRRWRARPRRPRHPAPRRPSGWARSGAKDPAPRCLSSHRPDWSSPRAGPPAARPG